MIDSLISVGLSTGVAVTALLALVLITRRAVTRRFGARIAYALWLLPIIRLLTPQISLPSNWNIRRWFAPLSGPAPEPAPIYVGYYDGVPPMPAESANLAFADIGPAALVILWLTGIIIGALWIVIRQRRYASQLSRMSLMPGETLKIEIARAVRQSGLKKAPTIRVSLNNDGPMVCGLIRPIIILPHGFTAQFTPQQRHLALLHELSHIRRGDLWTASAMMIFRLMNWPNPLVHLAWPRFRADQEAACDATVLRLTGETARADYAETLLTAARTAGRANPAPGTGLTLSLHHPVKERLMTLGTSINSRRGASRWGLAAMLLTGAALTAPLSFADDPTPPTPPSAETATTTSSQRSVHVVRAEFSDDEKAGYEIRNEDGVKTYMRVNRDRTTETLTREELEAEYDIDVDTLLEGHVPPPPPYRARLEGEPGLEAMSEFPDGHAPSVIVRRGVRHGPGTFEIEVEDGVRRVYGIGEDGERTELSVNELGNNIDIQTMVIRGDENFPEIDGEKRIRVFTTSNEISEWVSDDGEAHSFAFIQGDGEHSSAMAGARLQAAQSMLESTDEMLADMRENADGSAQRDLRSAERELEKARRALERARSAVERSGER